MAPPIVRGLPDVSMAMSDVEPASHARQMRRLEGLAIGTLVAAFCLLYFRPFVDLVGIWLSDENVSHSLLLIPIIACLVWARRARLAATPRRPTTVGSCSSSAACCMLLLGTAGVEFFLMRVVGHRRDRGRDPVPRRLALAATAALSARPHRSGHSRFRRCFSTSSTFPASGAGDQVRRRRAAAASAFRCCGKATSSRSRTRRSK